MRQFNRQAHHATGVRSSRSRMPGDSSASALRNTSRSLTVFLLAVFIGLTLISNSADAQSLDIKPSAFDPQRNSRPVSVLQNRFFRKSMRPEIGLIAGTVLNESYTSTFVQGIRTSMFVGEWVGIETQWLTTSVTDSADRIALNKLKYRPLNGDATSSDVIVSPDPDVNALHNMRDFAAVAAPFYGKLNLFNSLIVYSDLYVTAGVSKVGTDQGMKDAFLIGGGQRLYVYDSFSVRLDFRNRIFQEERAGEQRQRNSWAVDIGASYLFF